MKILALETSERIGSLAALVQDGQTHRCVAEVTLPSGQRAAQTLLPNLQSLLADLAWKPSDLDLITATSGPGSFTGCRLGVTTAKTLSYATGAKLVSVHTLAAIAAGVTADYTRLWTILDAQRGELYVSRFEGEETCHSPETKIQDAEQWLEGLQAGEMVAGPPLGKLKDQVPDGVIVADEPEWKPSAQFVGQLAIAAYHAGHTVDPIQLVPNYYRQSAAEEKADLQS